MAFEIAGYNLMNFAEMVNAIETYAHLILIVAAIYYLWLLVVGGQGKTGEKARTVGGWGADKATGLGGWFKDKGLVPFTKEKKERDNRKWGQAFHATMNEKIANDDLLGKMKKVKRDVEGLKAGKEALASDTYHLLNPKTDLKKFIDLFNDTVDALRDLRKEAKKWKRVSRVNYRAYPKQMAHARWARKMSNKVKGLDGDKLQEIVVLEREIIAKHEDTRDKLVGLKKELEDFKVIVNQALKAGRQFIPRFNTKKAQVVLDQYKFDTAVTLANECVKVQEEITKDNMPDLISRIKET